MFYVYILESESYPGKRYVGFSEEPDQRLVAHNAGQSPHTAKYRPWKKILSIGFADRNRALAFERYLKSGSGRAFANKHFL